jgi:hypothetical protein
MFFYNLYTHFTACQQIRIVQIIQYSFGANPFSSPSRAILGSIWKEMLDSVA